ncbi:ABC transporter ATP-binding protein [Pararobbsia silviterrae]|uniref:ABC transporter ATP-binding protein n=2 Tax=Pararobbsia silviterrae TaxID=1792498 RepID=A0A494XPW5_9BURK|nr:ABC transporter ATP-binding protein [Pararobbsia silviterrae]
MGNDLILKDVVAGYGSTVILENIALRISEGERVGLIGRNGAGKTTLLSTIVGLTHQIAGSISFGGRSLDAMPTYRRARMGIGLVPQTRDIFPTLTVAENLRSALCNGRDDVKWALIAKLFPRLEERRNNYGDQLSGGEQQMLAIARTLVTRPKLLLLDEPLEGLAPQLRDEVMDAIRALVDETGIGCVVVEQDVDVVMDFADRIVILERGTIQFDGTTDALRARPDVLEQTIGLSKIALAG